VEAGESLCFCVGRGMSSLQVSTNVSTFLYVDRHTIAVCSSSFLACDLASALTPGLGVMFGGELHSSNMPGASKWFNSSRSFQGSYPGSISGYDTLLVVERRKLPAHRVILASRSLVFAEMLAAEEGAGVAAGAKVELVVPDVSLDTALAMLEFMYTDNLAHPLTPLSPNVAKLLFAAQKYKLHRLAAMCKLLLASPVAEVLRGDKASVKSRDVASTDAVGSGAPSQEGSVGINDDSLENALLDAVFTGAQLRGLYTASGGNGGETPSDANAMIGQVLDLIDPELLLSTHVTSTMEDGLYCDAMFTSAADAAGLTETAGVLHSCRFVSFLQLFLTRRNCTRWFLTVEWQIAPCQPIKSFWLVAVGTSSRCLLRA
jgi:hypothetical protein